MFKMGLKKEFMSFARTGRLIGALIAIIGFALADPLIYKGLDALLDTNTPTISQEELPAELEDSLPALTDITGTSDLFDSAMVFRLSIADLTGTAMLIFMIVMTFAAGGELKKRATIIPNSTGLSVKGLLAPKFVFYPLFTFVVSFMGFLLTYGFCVPLFGSPTNFAWILAASAILSLYNMFIICAYFTLGLCTGRAGIATAVIYGLISIAPLMLSAFGAEKFHPFVLATLGANAIKGEFDATNIIGSITVTLLLIALFYGITYFVHSAKRINNIGTENALL